MNKKIRNSIIFWILIYYIFWWVIAFALSQKEKWLILENFKATQYDMIFNTDSEILLNEDTQIFDITRKINAYSNIKNKVSDKKNLFQDKKDELSNKITTLKDTIESLDDDIDIISQDIINTNSEIIELKKDIEAWNKKISLLRTKIKNNWEVLNEYLVYLFKKWNYIYDEDKIDNLKSILLSWEDISDVIDDMYFKWTIEVAGKKLIDDHKKYVKDMYIKKVKNEKQESKLKILRKNLIIERKMLNDKKEAKESLLKETKWQEILYKKYIEEKVKLERNLAVKELKEKIKFNTVKENLFKKYNCDFIDLSKVNIWTWTLEWTWLIDFINERWITERCYDLNNILYSESLLKSSQDTWYNLLSWPVNPIYWISAYFRDSWYKEAFWTDHDAIDIVAPQWTPIRAPKDWYVISILDPGNESYSYVALKHADWLVTVFWHVNEILVDDYEYVKEWQIIAKSWWEFWTKWAWVLTTWPHLHFEVFRDKEAMDPLNYLDISILPLSQLPDIYRYKFYSDFKNRKWYAYKNKEEKSSVFYLEWDSEIERQKSLLDKYAVWSFNDWDMWVEESLNWNIDPTFVMCIWLAESWLGKALKTPYNVWNVWNTDSWWTYSFSDAKEWVYRIVKTLNNVILWKYNEIKDLSRYWNKDWAIYASSSDHWHQNIIKCMSAIKWEYIPDYYNFRLSN